MAATLRRLPREPFPYVLEADREKPEAERPRFIIRPPSRREWAAIVDAAPGNNSALFEAAAQCIERVENHPDSGAFGAPNTDARRLYLDDVSTEVIRELGNQVALTQLKEPERKN